MAETHLIPAEEMQNIFQSILLQRGFSGEDAHQCATIFTTNSLEGVYTHGVNRFPVFVKMVSEGSLVPAAKPSLVHATPVLEQWDGALAPGMLNAVAATDRAVELARKNALGCVALANTNHWMRGGYYGWQAARKGCVFIGWSNTIANMPAYGAEDTRLGNNPFVMAVPYANEAIVLDMAMSQFSYGTLQLAQMRGETLPVYGGYNREGELTNKPADVLDSGRSLSIGYWKGAGFALLLDMVGAVLSGGQAVHQISEQKLEKGLSQVFMAIDLTQLHNYRGIEACIKGIIADYKQSVAKKEILYPGERVVRTREQNRKRGIPVLKKVWKEILSLKDSDSFLPN